MKGNFKFGLALLIVVIIAIAIIQASQKQPINWQRTYNPKDKIPFGTYVIRHELKHIFTDNISVKPVNKSLYTYFSHADTLQANKDLIFIGNYFAPGKTSLNSLLKFVARGNKAFISAGMLSRKLLDTLKLSTHMFDPSSLDVFSAVSFDSVTLILAGSNRKAQYNKEKYAQILFFDTLNKQTVTILGYLKREKYKLPNFIQVKYGSGKLYLQLTPQVYSNYFMLNPKTYPIAFTSLHYLNGKQILWYDGLFMQDEPQTPMRVILSHPALRAAWYLLLLTLILFMIFKSRREQAAIPIVKPEPNLSVAFTETIGSLYYENGSPGDMIDKKIKYFLYQLKKQYRFEDTDLNNPKFRQEAVLKLKMQQTDIESFFNEIKKYQNLIRPSTENLKNIQELIEDFKQKIKLS